MQLIPVKETFGGVCSMAAVITFPDSGISIKDKN